MDEKIYQKYCELVSKTVIPTGLSKDEMLLLKKPLVDFVVQHTPRQLYKFRACNERNIDAFRNQQIWFGTGSQMNDDFDARLYCDKAWLSNAWKAQIDDDGKLRVIKEYQRQGTIPPHIQKLFNSDILSILNANATTMDWDRLNAETIAIVEKLINVQLPFIDQAEQTSMKITSFSEDISSPYMWGHYADNNSGFALAYDFRNAVYNEQNLPISELYPIIYSDELLNATYFLGYLMQYTIASVIANLSGFPMTVFYSVIDNFIRCPDLFMQIKCLIHKSKLWDKEKEWRMTLARTDPHIKNAFVIKRPCAIYLGRKIKDTSELILRNIAYKQKIPVYKMTIDDTSKEYRLNAVRQKNTTKQLLLQ